MCCFGPRLESKSATCTVSLPSHQHIVAAAAQQNNVGIELLDALQHPLVHLARDLGELIAGHGMTDGVGGREVIDHVGDAGDRELEPEIAVGCRDEAVLATLLDATGGGKAPAAKIELAASTKEPFAGLAKSALLIVSRAFAQGRLEGPEFSSSYSK